MSTTPPNSQADIAQIAFESGEKPFVELGDQPEEWELPLRVKLGDGFTLESLDSQFQLRIRVLNQVDGKLFLATDQEPARSGLYIPRFRIYFEG